MGELFRVPRLNVPRSNRLFPDRNEMCESPQIHAAAADRRGRMRAFAERDPGDLLESSVADSTTRSPLRVML